MDGDENNQPVVEEKIEAAAPEAETASPEPAAEPVTAQAEEPAPEPEAEPQSEEEVADWREKQINKQHARLKESRRLLEERERQIADLQAMLERRSAEPAAGETELPKPSPRAVQPAVDEEAIRAQVELKMRLEQIGKAGETTYGDKWNKSLERLVQISGDGGIEDLPWMAEALDDPAKVLHKLGSNPAEAMRIAELPKARRQAEYVRMSMEQAPRPPKPSSAPAPVDPVKPRSQPTSAQLSDDMADEDWYAKRAEQRKASRAARGLR